MVLKEEIFLSSWCKQFQLQRDYWYNNINNKTRFELISLLHSFLQHPAIIHEIKRFFNLQAIFAPIEPFPATLRFSRFLYTVLINKRSRRLQISKDISVGRIRRRPLLQQHTRLSMCVPRLKIWKIVRRYTERSFRREAAMNSSAFPGQLLSSFPVFLAKGQRVSIFDSRRRKEKKRKRRNISTFISNLCLLSQVTFLRIRSQIIGYFGFKISIVTDPMIERQDEMFVPHVY